MSVPDCFSIGSIVEVRTCYNDVIEGQVIGFDLHEKLLILKCSSQTSTQLNDVFIVNLSLCKDINVKKDVNGTEAAEPPQSINLQRLSNRVRNQVEGKKRLVSALKANVGEEAQTLFMAISKTLSIGEVCWSGQDIIVFNEVTIKPPYKAENVEVRSENHITLEYVKKLVSSNNRKNNLDQQQLKPASN